MLDLAKCAREAVVVPRFTKVHAKLHNNLISTCSLHAQFCYLCSKVLEINNFESVFIYSSFQY